MCGAPGFYLLPEAPGGPGWFADCSVFSVLTPCGRRPAVQRKARLALQACVWLVESRSLYIKAIMPIHYA